MAPYTTTKDAAIAHAALVDTFKSGKTKQLAWRKWQLKQIFFMVKDNENAISEALNKDLNRSEFENVFMDIGGALHDVIYHLDHVEEWAADQIPDAGFFFGQLCKPRIRQEPLGVALIIGAFNFPVNLVLAPLIAAVSAGCCALVKPSEITESCQDLMADLIPKYLDDTAIKVVTGGIPETTSLLELKFDLIFYTGSPATGKIISQAAAKTLTPTVLELGGQGPVIVTKSANVDLAAKRIALSKYINAGQICLSSNHVFCDPSLADALVAKMSEYFRSYLSAQGKNDMVHIVSDKHFDRLTTLLSSTKGTIATGGSTSKSTRYIEPTIVTDIKLSDPLMRDEIFGPVLPIIPLDHVSATDVVRSMPHPLGLYIFSTQKDEIEHILSRTQSGGVTINDTMIHAAIPGAPFGGVGNSGQSAYKGKYGFDAFTHRRTVATVPGWADLLMGFRYPPYKRENLAKVRVKDPGFKRGEGMEGQVVGPTVRQRVRKVLRPVAWVVLIVLAWSWFDEAMGGEPILSRWLGTGGQWEIRMVPESEAWMSS